MKILTLGLGAFGFAINKLIGENNPSKTFFIYEVNKIITENIEKTREHPFFFEGYKLPKNIKIIDNIDEMISNIDLLIIAIPAQFISQTISGLKSKLKPGVTILNLSKGIDITTNNPVSKLLIEKLDGFNFEYCVLSGGMIAQELVEGKFLGADLGINNFETGNKIKKLFENKNFTINLKKDIINIELYGSLKNIMAIMVGYYQGLGYGYSTIGARIVEYYSEIGKIIEIYGGNKNLDFSYYSLGGDIIATCFGNSRNKYLGKLLGSGKNIQEALEILKSENKHSEGYETIKAVHNIIKDKPGFEINKFLYELIK